MATTSAIPEPEPGRPKDEQKLNRHPLWRHWKNIVPMILSLLALSISIFQYATLRDSAVFTTYDRSMVPEIELDRAFLVNADLRPYFYDNKLLEANDPARMRVLALAELMLDCFEVVLTHNNRHGWSFPNDQRTSDMEWIRDSFRSSPVLRDYLSSRRNWYSRVRRQLELSADDN